jgi:hypothetical protein
MMAAERKMPEEKQQQQEATTKRAADEKQQPGTEFRNEGLIRWERLRSEWRKPNPAAVAARSIARTAKTIDPDEIIDRIFSSTGNGALPVPVPLPQMIDILIDFWEVDGLYD